MTSDISIPELNPSLELLPQLSNQAFFDRVVVATLLTVSVSSQRIYGQTYRIWQEWCESTQSDPLDFRPSRVRDFLISRSVTRRTRQRQLSALRKLIRVLALDENRPEFRQMYEMLLMVKIPAENLGGKERGRKALSNQEVWRVLDIWQGNTLGTLRNRCLLAVMFYTGMRRAEIAALRWEDVDLTNGVINVRHGKGDRQRDVAIVEDSANTAVNALQAWKTALFQSTSQDRTYVFCPVGKGDRVGSDEPISAVAINQLIRKTAQLAGVDFKPHDARRTLGTDLLSNGNSISDVQAQLGHAHASTTIQSYALPADAKKRRSRFKASY